MNFEHNDKTKELIARLEAFMDAHIYSAEAVYAEQMEAFGENRWQVPAILEELKEKAKAEGLWNLFLPESERGYGLSNVEYAPLCEIMGRVGFAAEVFNCSAPDTGNMEVLERYGNDRHKKEYMEPLLEGKIRSAFLMTEPAVASSDATNIETRIERDGDEYVINGSKIWTTQGNYADYMILLARTNPDAETKYKGLSFFLAPMKAPGVETVPIRKLTGEYGFTQTFFTDARIPASSLMGQEGEGWIIAMETLEYERGARSGQAGGHVMMLTNPADIIDLAKSAQVNGRPAIEDPALREELVKLMTEARALGLNSRRDKIQPLTQDYPMSLALGSKLSSTDFYQRLNAFAISLQGTRGAYYVDDPSAHDNGIWQRGYLNSFSATIGGGTSQIQRNIIGEHVLGLPKG